MSEFIALVSGQLDAHLSRIEGCLNRLTEEQVWQRIVPDSNAVANLCIHLAGSEYQHIVSGIGGRPFIRERSLEFSRTGGITPRQLAEQLQQVRVLSSEVLRELDAQELDKQVPLYFSREDWKEMKGSEGLLSEPCVTRSIRGHLLYSLDHYAYHAGQIVLLAKWLGGAR